MDYLELFEDVDSALHAGEGESTSALAVAEGESTSALVPVAASSVQRMDDGRLVQVVGLGQARKNKGAAGLNSRGTADERKQWSLRLHLAKARKARYRDELYTLDLLSSLQRVSKSDRKIRIKRDRQGKIVGSQGLIKTASSFKLLFGNDRKSGKRIVGRNAQGLAMGASPSTVASMRAVCMGAIMAKQANTLAKIYRLCLKQRPQVAAIRQAWDETSQVITVKGAKGSWQVIVVKQSLVRICSSLE